MSKRKGKGKKWCRGFRAGYGFGTSDEREAIVKYLRVIGLGVWASEIEHTTHYSQLVRHKDGYEVNLARRWRCYSCDRQADVLRVIEGERFWLCEAHADLNDAGARSFGNDTGEV